MATALFRIKQGDLRPYLKVQLVTLTEDGEVEGPQDLTGATIVFSMRDKTTKEVIIETESSCRFLGDPTEGWVQYEMEPGDTDVIGSYLGEFEATYSGEPLPFPMGSSGSTSRLRNSWRDGCRCCP